MGGNHVMGLISSRRAEGSGKRRDCIVSLTIMLSFLNDTLDQSSETDSIGRGKVSRTAPGFVFWGIRRSARLVAAQKAVLSQLHVKALTRQSKHLGSRNAVVVGQLDRCLDAHLFDDIGRFGDNLFQRG